MSPAPKKKPTSTMAAYLSKRVHDGVRPGDKADNARLMKLARTTLAKRTSKR
jgi:hypothetical protein